MKELCGRTTSAHFRPGRGFGGTFAIPELHYINNLFAEQRNGASMLQRHLLETRGTPVTQGRSLEPDALLEGVRELLRFGTDLKARISSSGLSIGHFLLRGVGAPVQGGGEEISELVQLDSASVSMRDIDWRASARRDHFVGWKRRELEVRPIHLYADADWLAGSDWEEFSHNLARFVGTMMALHHSRYPTSVSIGLGGSSVFSLSAAELQRLMRDGTISRGWEEVLDRIWKLSIEMTALQETPLWRSLRDLPAGERPSVEIEQRAILILFVDPSNRLSGARSFFSEVKRVRGTILLG